MELILVQVGQVVHQEQVAHQELLVHLVVAVLLD